MIGRKAPQEPTMVPPRPERAEKRPTSDADCFKPSTFASRKAEAQQRRAESGVDPRELVHIGRTEHWMKDRRGKDIYVPGELYMERNKPVRRYIQLEGDPGFYPLFDESRKDPRPEPIGFFSRRSVLPSRYPPAGEEKTWRP